MEKTLYISTSKHPNVAYVDAGPKHTFKGSNLAGLRILGSSMLTGEAAVVDNINAGQIFSDTTDGQAVFQYLFGSARTLAYNGTVLLTCDSASDVLSHHLARAGQVLLKHFISRLENLLFHKGDHTRGSLNFGVPPIIPDFRQTWTNKSHSTFKLMLSDIQPASSSSLGNVPKPGLELAPDETVEFEWSVPFPEGLGDTSGYLRWWSKPSVEGMVGSGMTFGVKVAQDYGFHSGVANAAYTMIYVGSPTGNPNAWSLPVNDEKTLIDGDFKDHHEDNHAPYSFDVEGVGKEYVVRVNPWTGGAWRYSVTVTVSDRA